MSSRNDVDTLVGRHVRSARESAGLTQVQLAKLHGCSYNKIHNIETGTIRVTVADAFALARHLEVSPLFLMRDVIVESDVLRLFRDLVNERDRLAVEASTAVQRFSCLDEQISAIQQVVSRKGSEQ